MTVRPLFPNYTQLPQRVPAQVWNVLRVVSIGTGYAIIITAFIRPQVALFVFWKLIVPFLPILFFVAPGIWRNICPMAALNQTPRLFRFTRALTPPDWLKNNAYLIGIVMFLVIVPTRKALFNTNGPALGLLLLFAFTSALVGGYLFKGKSGWCSSICPLLPVQRLYGQSPFVAVPNGYCQPCVGCAKNCYDFNPRVASLADQYDSDRHYSGYRRIFAGVFPGLILAFYLVPDPPKIPVFSMYLQIAVFVLCSVGLFLILDTLLKASSFRITTLFGAVALNYYYLFNIPTMANTIHQLTGITVPVWITWIAHLTVFALTIAWILRTFRNERAYVRQELSNSSQIRSSVVLNRSIVAHQSRVAGNPEVTFKPEGKRILAAPGCTLLELAEKNGLHLEAGCRMGVCGADPIAVLEGMSNLSKIGSEEQSTLDRLGLAENTRMACCARIKGPVAVSLKPEKPRTPRSSSIIGFKYDESVQRVAIIGNGIAGITAADHIRRRHPNCQIHVIGREKHHLYNRMGLSRLIYGRSAMQGLYLMSDSWYEEHQITCWLNTHVTKIDPPARTIELADGEVLPFDKLILATGSSSTIPPIEGFGIPGTFVLREADDAMQIRNYVQQYGSHHAIVAGGGLLGLEAAYALHKLGLEVTVLERSSWPMRRQLDERGGSFLITYLSGLGIQVITDADTFAVEGVKQVDKVQLKDGRALSCDLFLVCAGITPNIQLANQAGLATHHGILVDDHMRTSDPNIFAAGDVAEYLDKVYGLWPVAVDQAEIAAVNVVGGDKSYSEVIPTTMLKVAGVDLTSIGRFEAESANDRVIVLEDSKAFRYRKLVIAGDEVVGAILLGYPEQAPSVLAVIKEHKNVRLVETELEMGNWDVLNNLEQSVSLSERLREALKSANAIDDTPIRSEAVATILAKAIEEAGNLDEMRNAIRSLGSDVTLRDKN
ncbi:MAG: FAD-dependent oxidoreductase [Chloroflexota bacterium]